ncbi:hypothetical protein BDW02DRAFT_593572 [Decorospora gaudefroyi]|uniref:Uncharacterized protein n=1 Tax=Decorospora gaudefroyi TaxID=184978 RepID=A0A6A5KWB8_9PLEO|nr:hypothetical protein BDW02DRAFT_593572 [Decorospora gaudefroyi]
MSSSELPIRSRIDPQDPETYLRFGAPVPKIIRIRELQAYKDWVKNGGLERFAKAHNVEPDFLSYCSRVKFDVIRAFYHELATVPGLEAFMAPTPIADLPSIPFEYGIQIMQDTENGWSSGDDTEDEEDDGKQTERDEKLKVEDVSRKTQS